MTMFLFLASTNHLSSTVFAIEYNVNINDREENAEKKEVDGECDNQLESGYNTEWTLTTFALTTCTYNVFLFYGKIYFSS